MKILVTYNLFREGFNELESKYDVTFPEKDNFTYDEVLNIIDEFDVLCSMFNFKVDEKLINKGTNLKLISNYAVGYDNIDINYATQKNIVVTNTPNPVTAPTANLALSLMLDVARKVSECDRKLRSLQKEMNINLKENLGQGITGKTLGIIGMGRIGKALAKRAIACGMEIVYYNRRQLSLDEETKYNATYLSFDQLIEEADFISLNLPYTPENKHIIGKNELDKMKNSAILINTARGPLIDEKALITALQNNDIYGVGLDVFEFGDYPSPELLKLDQVVLTPHIGTQTSETRLEMTRAVANNVIGFIEKDRAFSRVN